MPYAKFKDLDMHYEKLGLGETVMFLHSGYSRGILAFASQLQDFQRKFTCYYPDFRGHGRTKCESLEWSTPQLAVDIVGFMDSLNIPKAHFVGYSLGASVATYCAVNHPDRVATLSTIGASGFCDPTGVEEFEPEWLIEHKQHDTINAMLERHEDAHRGNWKEFMRQSAIDWRLYPQLTEEQIRSIRCPALLIAGEHDKFANEHRLKYFSSLIKGSKYLVVPGGSHRPHMLREQPILVNDAIIEFIEANPMQIAEDNF